VVWDGSPTAGSADSARRYSIAGISIRVEADLPFAEHTFQAKFRQFRVEQPGPGQLVFRHHFYWPDLSPEVRGEQVFHAPRYDVFRGDRTWTYLDEGRFGDAFVQRHVAVFNDNHTAGDIYTPDETHFLRGDLPSLSRLASDQIVLCRLLTDYEGCVFHSAGMVRQGQGLLFVGHSEAGKSTMVTMLQEEGEILCDDRIIVRRWPEGLRIHGTWSHGTVPLVSASSAPLRAIFFIEKSTENRIIPLDDRREVARRLPLFVVRPVITRDWWERTLALVQTIVSETPAYRLLSDKSGRIREVIRPFPL
jgi:hypothetical protein